MVRCGLVWFWVLFWCSERRVSADGRGGGGSAGTKGGTLPAPPDPPIFENRSEMELLLPPKTRSQTPQKSIQISYRFCIEFWSQNGAQNDLNMSKSKQKTASAPKSDFKCVFLQIWAQKLDPEPWKSLNSLSKTKVFHNLTCFMVDHILVPKHTKIDLKIYKKQLKTTSNNQSTNSLKNNTFPDRNYFQNGAQNDL